MTKSPKLEKTLNTLSKQLFNRERFRGSCVTCGRTNIHQELMKDPLSLKEYQISGMCLNCQNSVFDPEKYIEPIGKCRECGELCFEQDGGTEYFCCEDHQTLYMHYLNSSAY